jgi:outer membrane receptor protein involved in Fe transport
MPHSVAALAVLAMAIACLAPPRAWGQEPEGGRLAQADSPEAARAEAPEGGGGAEAPQPAAPARRARDDIEEIVVHAGESEAVADLSAGDSVTGFDASDLEALGAQSIEDLAGFTPNLEIVTTGSTTPTFFIRGVGLNDFNANSSGAVSIYQDDIPKNSPALQLGTLFDMEAVNILRGPQGTGPARNASAGAIKLYSRKPTGNFGGYLRSEFGNYDSLDFEGAVEMPLFEDMLSSRFAFRYSDRDGTMENRCGSSPRATQEYSRQTVPRARPFNTELVDEGGFSTCGERVFRKGVPNAQLGGPTNSNGFSPIPFGVDDEVNDRGNWATRGTLRFQPTLDQDWLLTGSLSQRDEKARLGQSLGTGTPTFLCDESRGTAGRPECQVPGFGSVDGQSYQSIELLRLRNFMDPCLEADGSPSGTPNGKPGCTLFSQRELSANATRLQIASDLEFDSYPHEGDFNRTGDVTNDVWGWSLKGDVAIGDSLNFTTTTGFDAYERSNETDLDFTPNRLFELSTDDDGWQFVEGMEFSGSLPGELPINWSVGGFALIEEISANTEIFLPTNAQIRAVTERDWTQKLYSGAGYFSFDWDFFDDFTLDGGVRYNWEKKEMDMVAVGNGLTPESSPDGSDSRQPKRLGEEKIWQEPTGTLRLTYRFREDTHAYWKYTRGWKGGHFNVTVASGSEITIGEPETLDAFEAGLRGSWFNGRLGLSSSIFHYAYEDYQIFTVVIPLAGTPEFVVLNASDAEVYGGELEMTARPIPGLFLEARASWLETQFLEFIQEQAQTRTLGLRKVNFIRELDFSGNSLLNSPEFKVSLTADQTVPLGRYGSMNFRWDGAWTDEVAYDASEGAGTPTFEGIQFMPDNTIGQKAYWLHNFRVGYRTPDGGIELAAWVRNATDEVYKTFAFDASALQINRTTIYFLGDPRTYGLSLTATF